MDISYKVDASLRLKYVYYLGEGEGTKRAKKEEKALSTQGAKKRGRKPKSSAKVLVEEVAGVGANLQGEGEEADALMRIKSMPRLRQPEKGLLWKAPVAKMY
ncbi:hypothetical protein GGP41_010117 [Bipolaris sorokiniana]|uniref:Uncharacterized protein n=1 Tax=Cochliobolus sativus TaxID=45130 RepID=A0A8H5ZH05_COCSA|nr:hypothetical protein GGP41_010117 [Bipolaris sorokiniana]